jgi:uncharacterized spore protein YtfJ
MFDVGERLQQLVAGHLVWGEPIERDGVTVVPASVVRGGGGGGEGEQPEGAEGGRPAGSGSGSGMGLVAHPAGALVLDGQNVRWVPAINVNRIVLGGQLVAVAALLVVRQLVKRH